MKAYREPVAPLKNSIAMNGNYCTLVQVDPMKQGDYHMRHATDKNTTSYYRLLNKKELAELMNCTERTVDRLVASNQVPFTFIPTGAGGKLKRRFIFGAIVEWLEERSFPHRQNAEAN